MLPVLTWTQVNTCATYRASVSTTCRVNTTPLFFTCMSRHGSRCPHLNTLSVHYVPCRGLCFHTCSLPPFVLIACGPMLGYTHVSLVSSLVMLITSYNRNGFIWPDSCRFTSTRLQPNSTVRIQMLRVCLPHVTTSLVGSTPTPTVREFQKVTTALVRSYPLVSSNSACSRVDVL